MALENNAVSGSSHPISPLSGLPRLTGRFRRILRERAETNGTEYEEAESRQLFCRWFSDSICRSFTSTNLRFTSWISRESSSTAITIRINETSSSPTVPRFTSNLCSSSSACSTFASFGYSEEIDDQRKERSTSSTTTVETRSSDRSEAVEEISTWRCAGRLDFGKNPDLLAR